MKISIQFLLLILMMGMACKESKVKTTNIAAAKFFEDQILKGTLSNIKIQGNKLVADLTLKNKTNQSTSIQLKDFVFTAKNNDGKIVQKDNLVKTGSWQIPDYEDLTDDEKFTARLEKMKEVQRKRIHLSSFWTSEISLDANEKATRKIEVRFLNKIEKTYLEFYFNGEHKRLLKI